MTDDDQIDAMMYDSEIEERKRGTMAELRRDIARLRSLLRSAYHSIPDLDFAVREEIRAELKGHTTLRKGDL